MMVCDGDKCFRLRGLPGDWDTEETKAFLQAKLSADEDIDLKIHSLACHPTRPGEKIATLGFSKIPTYLKESQEHFIKLGERRQLMLDTHFEGFTPLHSIEDEEAQIDIVALSGLNGHAFGSFKQKKSGRMWLRDDLPCDLEHARVFVYGYDTNPNHNSFQNIYDISEKFRLGLSWVRKKSETANRRPLVLLAHSLGGIITKAAVVAMAESSERRDRDIVLSLRGIFLFGVPSQGMNIESLIPMVPESSRRTLLYTLDDKNSPTLRKLAGDFSATTRKLCNVIIANLYETRESRTAEKQDDGSWAMSGPYAVLVKPDSATQGNFTNEDQHRALAINRTHSDLVKLSGTNDDVYVAILQWLKEIGKKVDREKLGLELTAEQQGR